MNKWNQKWMGWLAGAMVLAVAAVYAGVSVGPGGVTISVDEVTDTAISEIVSATNDTTMAAVNGKVGTNAVFDAVAVGDGSLLTNVTANTDLSRVGTNAVFDAVAVGDGSLLTNVTANTDLSRASTNQLGGITFVMVNGTNLLAVTGTTTNQVYLAPYTPPE